MARFYDAHWREAPMYEVRDRVWLNSQNITMTRPMKNCTTNGSDHIQLKRLSREVLTDLSSLIIQPNPPVIFSHTTETLQH